MIARTFDEESTSSLHQGQVTASPLDSVLAILPWARRMFVGGVAASGKTTACARAQRSAGLSTESIHVGALACDLAPRRGLVEDSMETAPISALDRLQELVHEVLRERLAATRDGIDVMWLDGHFVIGADSERPYPVAAQWFGGLGLDALVICMAAPAVIRARRKLDRTRGRVLADIGQIAAAQARELRHGSLLATALGLPLVEAWPDGTCRLHPEARGAATPCW